MWRDDGHEGREILGDDLDEDFQIPTLKKKKIDVMGHIARTADARGLSIRDRTALAASVANSLSFI